MNQGVYGMDRAGGRNDHLRKHAGWRRRCGEVVLPILLCTWVAALPGCARMVSTAAGDLTDNLADAVANHDDPATVRSAAPAYLLMLDGMIRADPDNVDLLAQAASLYGTYAAAFVDDAERSGKLTRRSLAYAEKAVCLRHAADCGLRAADFEVFEDRLRQMAADDLPLFYTLGSSWAGWIQAHRDDLDALADIARVEAIMQRVVELDPHYRDGGAHLYLGAFAIIVPPALGGRPEAARRHFEKALTLSGGRNLMAKVVYARQYARMVYDRELHDRLLTEVLAADPNVPGMVLENNLAQERARALLAEADAYF